MLACGKIPFGCVSDWERGTLETFYTYDEVTLAGMRCKDESSLDMKGSEVMEFLKDENKMIE